MNRDDLIRLTFEHVYGLPCWNAKSGWGSFLTMEFGLPHLEIEEPSLPKPGWSPRLRRLQARRHVFVHGEWHLWIYCCAWKVYTGKKLVGDSALTSTSQRRIVRAAKELDGQELTGIEIEPSTGRSTFMFDLGSRLETTPYDADSKQWHLYEPTGNILTYRADGLYSHQPGSTLPANEKWSSFD